MPGWGRVPPGEGAYGDVGNHKDRSMHNDTRAGMVLWIGVAVLMMMVIIGREGLAKVSAFYDVYDDGDHCTRGWIANNHKHHHRIVDHH